MNREGSSFYTSLASKATATEREISKVSSDPKFAQTFVASLLSVPGNAPSSSSASAAVFESKVQAKTLLMDNAPIDPDVKAARKSKRLMQRKRNRTKALSVKEKKALGLHRIPKEAIK